LKLHRPDLLQELQQFQTEQLQSVQEQLDAATARAASIERRERIVQLLEEHHLPLPNSRHETARRITSDAFIETLLAATNEGDVKRLVEERAALVRSAHDWRSESTHRLPRPTSRDQLNTPTTTPRTAQEFATAISSR
jgi:hypothetical protein